MTNQPTPLDPAAATTIKEGALASLRSEQSATVHLSLATDVFAAGHTFNLVDTQLTVRHDAALVFVDHQPHANWGHPCTYQFYDTNSGQFLYQEDALFPPNLTGGLDLEVFHAAVVVPTISPALETLARISLAQLLPRVSQAAEQRYAVLFSSQISNLRHVEDLEFFWRTLVNVYGFSSSNSTSSATTVRSERPT